MLFIFCLEFDMGFGKTLSEAIEDAESSNKVGNGLGNGDGKQSIEIVQV